MEDRLGHWNLGDGGGALTMPAEMTLQRVQEAFARNTQSAGLAERLEALYAALNDGMAKWPAMRASRLAYHGRWQQEGLNAYALWLTEHDSVEE